MGSERARVWLGAVLALAVAGGIAVGSANLRWREGPVASPYAGDFIHEYSTAWIVLHGDAAELYSFGYVHEVQHDPARMGFTWDADSMNVPYYPPPYYALIAPLAWLDYRDAAHFWIALQFLALAASFILLVRTHPALRPALWWALPVAVLFPPVALGLVSGQKGALWLLVFAGTWGLLRSERPVAAGVVFGLLALKPPLALVLGAVMLARREWGFLAGAVATGLALVAASLPLGSEAWSGWIGAMLEPVAQDRDVLLAKSHCWLGFARVALGTYAGAGVVALTLVLDGLTLAALFPLWRGSFASGGPRRELAFAAALLATVLVSPHLYSYDLTLLIAVFAIVGAALAEDGGGSLAHPARVRRALLGVFLLVAATTTTGHPVALRVSVPALFAMQTLLARAAVPSGH
jgi:hypothetical protein